MTKPQWLYAYQNETTSWHANNVDTPQGNCSYSRAAGGGEVGLIEYRLRRKARREDTLARLRAIVASPRSAALDTAARIQRDAEALAETMTEIHGGRWTVKISHDCHYVLVAREFE